MTTSPRLLGGTVAAATLLAAAGCGGGGREAATTPRTSAGSPAAERAQIAHVWERFFAGSTSASEKVSLLQNGGAFAKAIEAQASSPLAKQSSAKVSRVTLTGPSTAKVRYTIDLSGKPALPNQTGTAVKEGGSWKVGAASFCALLELQGAPPKACAQAG